MEAGKLLASGTPGRGQGGGQGGLLVEQLTDPVAHAAGLDEDDLGAAGQPVGQHLLVGTEPGQPRLHALEHLTLGQPLPLLAAPRLGPDQPAGPLPHVVGREQLPAAEELDLVEIVGRALVGDGELGQPIHLVAPEVDADRHLACRREHVDDRAPHGDLAAVLDLVLPAVAAARQAGDQADRVQDVPGGHHDRGDLRRRGAPTAGRRARTGATITSGSRSRRSSVVSVAEPPQHPQPTAHRLHVGADPLERERLPGREQLHLARRPEEGGQIVGQMIGVAGGRDGDDDRAAAGRPGPGRRRRRRGPARARR